jgi:CHAT domain-containing protein
VPDEADMRQIELVEYSLRIIKNVYYWSNWAQVEDKRFPSSDPGNHEWLGYYAWQATLVRRGKYWQALTILDLTATCLSPETVSAGFKDLISRCQQDASPSSKVVALAAMISSSRHSIACSDFSNGRKLLQKAKDLFQELSKSDRGLSGAGLVYDLQVADLEANPETNTTGRARQYQKLALEARDARNFGRADAWLTTATELALQSSAWAEFLEWRQENERIQAEVMSDFPSLLLGRSRHWRFGGGRDLAKLIEWYDNFDEAHSSSDFFRSPDIHFNEQIFDIPITLHSKETAKRVIFGRLGDEKSLERLQESEELLSRLQQHLPGNSISSNLEPYLKDFANIDARDTYGPLRVLINRIIEALSNNSIGLIEAADLLALSEVTLEQIQNVTPEALHNSLFATPGNLQWPKRLLLIKAFLERDTSATITGAGTYLLVRLQQLRMSKIKDLDEVERENIVFLELISACQEVVRQIFRRNELHSKSTIALCKLERVKIKEMKNFPPVDASDYDDIVQIYNECLEAYQAPSLSRQLGEIALLYVRLADTCQRKRRQFNKPAIADIEKHMSSAESLYDELRHDLAALKSSSSLIGKTGFTSAIAGVNQLRDVAYRVYRHELLFNPGDKEAQINLWNWVQKSKGRALTDAMGLSVRIPAELLQTVQTDQNLNQKLARWDAVNLELKEALQKPSSSDSANDIFYLRIRRNEVKQELLLVDELADLINVVEGRAIQYTEIENILSTAKKADEKNENAIVLVDWLYVTNIWGGRELYFFAIRYSGGPESNTSLSFFPQGAAYDPVNSWIARHLQEKDLQAAQPSFKATSPSASTAFAELQKLNSIILPLKSIAQPGDTLVLCPTDSLHRLPLHAMYLPSSDAKNELLIERNPVVYCHSLSIFRFCVYSWFEASESYEDTYGMASGFFPLNLRELEGIDDYTLRERATQALRSLILEEEAVIQTSFYKNVNQSKMVFFLGHVHDAGSAPLESHLVLYEVPGQERRNCHHLVTEIVRAADILENAQLSRGAHVILISCASGLVHSKATDEYLGLLPAFIYSGARSTVSTLWPIKQVSGVEFSNSYFENWMNSRVGSGIANLAKCMQGAVLELLGQYPVHDLDKWGAFVFHGYWMYANKITRRSETRNPTTDES